MKILSSVNEIYGVCVFELMVEYNTARESGYVNSGVSMNYEALNVVDSQLYNTNKSGRCLGGCAICTGRCRG